MISARALLFMAVLSAAAASGRADDTKTATAPLSPTGCPDAAPTCCAAKRRTCGGHFWEWLTHRHGCAEAAPSCSDAKCRRCDGHLWAWLTYRPESRMCGCPAFRPPCAPYRPPLYAYFLDNCASVGGCCDHAAVTLNGPSTCSKCADHHSHLLAGIFKKKCENDKCVAGCAQVDEEAKPTSK